MELRDYRPINLVSGVYKIIAKTLTERLMIKYKVTFIKGRQIMNVEPIASECVDTRLKGDDPSIMCKTVNWI